MPGKMRKPTGATRPPSLRGAIIIDETRGSPRVRAWPRPRGQDRHPTNIFWTNWLQWATYLYRYYPAQLKADLEQQTAGTPWMPRDVAISAMRARAWYFKGPDGRTYYPMAARDDISNSLDIIAQLPGQMLFRASGLWVPILSGTPGDQLTYVSDDDPPVWQAPANNPFRNVCILRGGIAATTFNVNSTTYVETPYRRFTLDLDVFTPAFFQIIIIGNSNAAAQTVTAQLARPATPATPISPNGNDLVVTNTNGYFASGWLAWSHTGTGLQDFTLALKGSNATVDLSAQEIEILLK